MKCSCGSVDLQVIARSVASISGGEVRLNGLTFTLPNKSRVATTYRCKACKKSFTIHEINGGVKHHEPC